MCWTLAKSETLGRETNKETFIIIHEKHSDSINQDGGSRHWDKEKFIIPLINLLLLVIWSDITHH